MLQDTFYISEERPQWFLLLLKDTHYCISCGDDIEVIKKVIYKYTRKYRTEERLYSAMSKLTDKGTVSPKTFTLRQTRYDSGEYLFYEDVVGEVVEKANIDNRQDTPFNRVKRLVKAKPIKTIEEVNEVNTTTVSGNTTHKVIAPRHIKHIKV